MQQPTAGRVIRSVLAGLFALVANTPTATGQGSLLAPDSVLSPCLAAHAAERWPARQIFVYAELADSLDREYVSSAGAIANVVALMARDAYGSRDSVVAGEPALSWLATQSAVRVKAYRDGRLVWSTEHASNAAADAGPELIRQVLAELGARSATVQWPAMLASDSVQFRLFLGPSEFRARTADEAYRFAQSSWPPFTLRMPPIQPPTARSPVAVSPRGAHRVRVEWVVDSAGVSVPSSFRLVGADDLQRMGEADARAFRAFVDVARTRTATRRFRPGRIAGCAAAMTVTDEFDYLVP